MPPYLALRLDSPNLPPRPRLYLPDVDHKLCRLSSDWCRHVIAAVLVLIGDADICAVMAAGQFSAETTVRQWLQQWSGSLEWLIHFIRPAYRHGLYRRAERWPRQLRARYNAGVTAMY